MSNKPSTGTIVRDAALAAAGGAVAGGVLGAAVAGPIGAIVGKTVGAKIGFAAGAALGAKQGAAVGAIAGASSAAGWSLSQNGCSRSAQAMTSAGFAAAPAAYVAVANAKPSSSNRR